MLRVAVYLIGALHRTQGGLLERDQHRVVGDGAVDSAGAETEHQPRHAIGVADPRRPSHLAARECDTGKRREEHATSLTTHNLLDEDSHLLLEIDQTPLTAVLDGVGVEERGVDLRDGVLEGRQTHLESALVGDEETLILARKGVADAVLEQARGSDHQRHLTNLVEHLLQTLVNGRWEGTALEETLDQRKLVAHLLRGLVFDVDELVELVVLDELEDAV